MPLYNRIGSRQGYLHLIGIVLYLGLHRIGPEAQLLKGSRLAGIRLLHFRNAGRNGLGIQINIAGRIILAIKGIFGRAASGLDEHGAVCAIRQLQGHGHIVLCLHRQTHRVDNRLTFRDRGRPLQGDLGMIHRIEHPGGDLIGDIQLFVSSARSAGNPHRERDLVKITVFPGRVGHASIVLPGFDGNDGSIAQGHD